MSRKFYLAAVPLFSLLTACYLSADDPQPAAPPVTESDAKATSDPAAAEEAKPETAESEAKEERGPSYMQVIRDDDDNPIRLELAIVRFVPATGEGKLAVDLVSAVHVGDASYYDALNKAFEDYEVVLYELVARKGTRVPKGGKKPDGPLSFMQGMLQGMLELESQTARIDYTKENFVHADMSPEEMQEAMEERGEDGLTIALSTIADMMRQANRQQQRLEDDPELRKRFEKQNDLDPLSMLFDPDAPLKMKRMMAEQFALADSSEEAVGASLNTLLVEDRNQAALEVFKKQLAAGKKKIAIFYGAMHMPDFEKRLVEEYGLKRESVRWLAAWDMREAEKDPREGDEDGGGLKDLFRLLEK